MNGEELAVLGMRRAMSVATPEEVAAVDEAILWLRDHNRGEGFTSDQVHFYVHNKGVELKHPNIVGSRFRYWGRKKMILRSNESRPSTRPKRHGSLLAVWIKRFEV